MLQHSFGGSALDRYLFDFETVMDGPEATAGDPAGDATAAPPGGEAADAAAAGAPPASPSWSSDDPAFLDAVNDAAARLVDARLGEILPYLGAGDQPGQEGVPQHTPIELDPFGDDFGGQLQQLLAQNQQQTLDQIQQMLQGVTAPLQAQQEAELEQRGNDNIATWVDENVAAHGELPAKAKAQVKPLAEQLWPQLAERYGASPRVAKMAVDQAAAQIRDLVDEARGAGAAGEAARVEAIAGARVEPQGGAAGLETTSDVPLSGRELALKYGRRASAVAGT